MAKSKRAKDMGSGVKSNCYVMLMQFNLGLGSMVCGFLLTMINSI